jgi:hypothetical protein
MVANRSCLLMSSEGLSTSACPVCRSVDFRSCYEFVWGKILQCRDCTCAFAHGSNVDSENDAAFSNDDLDEDMLLYRQWASERLSTLLRFVNSGNLLEFGAGTGEFLHEAAVAGFSAVGVDKHPRIRKENEHPRISIVRSDARGFRTDHQFDVVAALHVLEHFSDPYDFLDAIRRNLTDNGVVLIEVPNYASLSRVATGRRWNCFVSYHALQLTPSSMVTLLKRAGFEVLSLESVGCGTTQVLGLGIPWLGRRIGLSMKYGWQPPGAIRQIATSVEHRMHWGNNLRVVARKS